MYEYYRKKIFCAETDRQLDRILSAAARCAALTDYEYGLLCATAMEKMKEDCSHGKY